MSRDALIVGLNTYQHLHSLKAPAQDAEAIAQQLERDGDFRVTRLPEVIQQAEVKKPVVAQKTAVFQMQLKRALKRLFLPDSTQAPETALFYFSGHGIPDREGYDRGYLGTSDIDPDNPTTGISLRWLQWLLSESPVKQQIVWLDCCHSGSLIVNVGAANPGNSTSRDRCFIASSRDFESSWEDLNSPYSVLTHALLKGLDPNRLPGRWIDTFALVDYVNQALKGELQTPVCTNFGEAINLTRSLQVSERATVASTPDSGTKPTPPNNIPRKGTRHFIGRDEDLQHLHEQLQQSQPVVIKAIAGMGGIGKTELALQYARTHWQQHYPGGVCWLEARDRDFVTQILNFAQAQLGLQLPENLPEKERIAYCWHNWPGFSESSTAALVVIDDVSDYSAIEDYLPIQARFTLLLTTRQQRLAATVQPFAIEVLSEAAALELLRQLAEDAERIDAELEKAKALCQWLGYLPLGLELVGRYLAIDLDLSLAELQRQLDEQELEAEALTEMEAGMTASRNLTKAIELTWQRLSAEAQDLACLLGVFAPAPIPWPRVEACYSDIEPAILKRLRNLELIRFNLLQRVEQARYQLHPVVHRFIRTKLAENSPLIAAYCGVMVKAAQEVEQTPTLAQIAAWREMVPHVAEAAMQWVSRVKDEELTWPFTGLGWFYEGQGLYDEAEVWQERCVTVTQARLGNEHPAVATSLNNLATLYPDQGRYEEAETLYSQALEITKASLGDNHPNVAISLNNLATLYSDQGRYGDAEPLYLQALKITKANLGDVATNLNNLALLYKRQGRYGDAEPLYLQSLEIDIGKASLGEARPNVAASLNNLANLYSEQRRYEDAETLYLKALEITKASQGDNHPNVVTRLNNLATLYQVQGRYREAELLYIEALGITQHRLGENRLDTQIIGDSFVNCLKHALDSGQANTLSDHPMTQQLLQQLRSQGEAD